MERFDILKPPQSYIDFRCAMHDVRPEDFENKRKKFFEKNSGEREIEEFTKGLQHARHRRTLPVEKIEIREIYDDKKHGRVIPMMVYDIEYEIKGGEVVSKKIYQPLEPQYDPPEWGPKYNFYNEGKFKTEDIPKTVDRISPEDFEILRQKAKAKQIIEDEEIPF